MFFSSYVHPFTKELDEGFCYLPFIAKRRLKSILWLLTLYPRWGICSMLDEKKSGGLEIVCCKSVWQKERVEKEALPLKPPKQSYDLQTSKNR